MKFEGLSATQIAAVVRAMNAVVTDNGRMAPLPIETECVEAAQRHLLGLEQPLAGLPNTLPDDLATAIDTPSLRKATVRLMAILSTVDKQISPEKVAVVETAAAQLGVAEFGLRMLRGVSQRKYSRSGFELMKRMIEHQWSYTGKATMRDWLAILWPLMPWFPGLRRYLRLDETLRRYESLATLPDGTLGSAVHRYYAKRGFPMPGQRRGIPEGWGRHEVYHVVANYNTNIHGEMLLAGFIAGNTDELSLDVVLPALVQMHAGKKFVAGGPTSEDRLKPDDFFRAIARGASMNTDLLKGWKLWPSAAMGLDEFRQCVGIPAFSALEYDRLKADKGLLEA